MNTLLRSVFCLLVAAVLAPAHLHVAQDVRPDQQQEEPGRPSVYQFSEAEISAARDTLAALTPEQRALVNHLRYLMRPQYEEALMAGRAFAPCPLPPFEQPGTELESRDVLRLWAVLASGMPITESTERWLQLFINAPVPSAEDSLSEVGLHMAVCAIGARRSALGLGAELTNRATELLESAHKARRVTARNSHLIDGREIDPKWFGNQLWLTTINVFALEMNLKIQQRTWETALQSLLDAGKGDDGWRSKSQSNSEAQDLDTNLFSIAALSLAASAPEGRLGSALTRRINQRLATVPAVLKRLESDYAGSSRAGTRLAMILSFAPELAPEGADPKAWRKLAAQSALTGHDPSGMVFDGGSGGRELGVAIGRQSLRVAETALACVALSGGIMGTEAPLAGMNLNEVGRAMHACSVLHASALPEGLPRIFGGDGRGHSLPEPGAIEKFMLKGLDYLVDTQHPDGGWGSARMAAPRGTQQPASYDPGSTAFVAMSLMRAGHTPFQGKHSSAVLKAATYIVEAVEKADEDGPRITKASGSQLQSKLGQIVDTALVTQFLARVLPTVESDRKLHQRVEAALDKCIRKIEASQGDDGGWITSGWAPVLQSAMFNQALELAEVAGREVDPAVLARSREFLRGGDEAKGDANKTEAVRRSTSAGIAFYAGSSAMRATAADTAEVTIAFERAIRDRVLPAKAEVNEKNLRKIGYSEAEAAAKAAAYQQHAVWLEKLNDEKYLKGFGNNGGEEFISYMMSSESIVITGHDTWDKWNQKMHTTFEKIQNADGSWSGHHCISSPVLCTAAVLLCLTADREIHALVETGPSNRTTSSRSPASKPDGPVTGNK